MTQVRVGIYGRQSRNKAKSIAEQIQAGLAAAAEEGWQVIGSYRDGSSASRHARTVRDDWPRVLADISAGLMDVLILWESSRGDRTPETWFAFLSLCRDKQVRVHVIQHERTYNLGNARDWKVLAEDGVANAYESELLSIRVRRGHAGAAAQGRPAHGRTPYGYRRVYDHATGDLLGQEPDESTAPTVREIIERIADGEPISSIVDDLNARQVPTLTARTWYRARVRDLATNRAYVGLRVHNGQTYPASWPALVEPSVFWAAQRVLTDPARVTTRPGRQRHLLSYLGTCEPCGAPLTTVRGRYRCLAKGCVTVVQADLDGAVVGILLARLARQDSYAAMRQATMDADHEVIAAQNMIAELRGRLTQWRQSAARGETTPASLAAIEADLTKQIQDAERQLQRVSVPPALRKILEPGADVQERWSGAPLATRRDIIRTFAVITVQPAAATGRRAFDPWRLAASRWVGVDETWGEEWVKPLAPDSSTI